MGGDGEAGFVYKVERFCVHDGPGIRTLFYFRGCPLGCLWCCNPESRTLGPIRGEDEFLMWKQPVGVQRLVELACRDVAYYRSSGGGVTLTGGEALAQPEFAANLLRKMRERGIHTAMETSGHAGDEAVETVLPHLDMVLLDIKHMDDGRHKALTGFGNARILSNARKIHDAGVPMTIRVPLIPGHNDREEDLRALGEFVWSALPAVKTLCVLGYHNYAVNKYLAMGLDYPLGDLPPASEERITRAAETLKRYVEEVRMGG
ncbi:MAG: glycyl-radical enzyme activating protein [Planctomycetota bacterium]|jgi:pyruvate formate lyase activating enzyme|nr:glycyl-radical enzyme activating protein [Planctomycetota bacterium]